MSGFQVLDCPADRIDGEAVAALFFEDERPVLGPAAMLDWRLNGLLTNLLIEGRAHGRAGEHVLVRSNGKVVADWILFMGGGSRRGLGRQAVEGLLRHVLNTCREAGFTRFALCLDSLAGMEIADIEGMMTAALTTMDGPRPDCRLAFFNKDADAGFRG
jgi:hypothetical protein